MKLPDTLNNNLIKLKFFYRTLETLRNEHNGQGAKVNSGEITRKEFDDYVNNDFLVKQKEVLNKVAEIRDSLGLSEISKRNELLQLKEVSKNDTSFDKDIKNIWQ